MVNMSENLKVKYNMKNGTITIQLYYGDIFKGDVGANTYFSTYPFVENTNGFIKLPKSFYLKLEVAPIDNSYKRREVPLDLLEVDVNQPKKIITWMIHTRSVFATVVNGDIRVYSSSFFQSDELNGLFYSLTVFDHHPSKIYSINTNDNLNDQLKSRDIGYADQYHYNNSPNTDSPRRQNEYLAGTASNMGKYKK